MSQINESLQQHLMDWAKMVEKNKIEEDTWTTLSVLPNISFKNLRMVSDGNIVGKCDNVNELNITLKFDEFKPIDEDGRT